MPAHAKPGGTAKLTLRPSDWDGAFFLAEQRAISAKRGRVKGGNPLQGQGAAPLGRVWGSRPNVPHREAPKKQELQRSRRRPLRFRAGRFRARRTLTGLLYGPALMKKRNKRGRAYQPRLMSFMGLPPQTPPGTRVRETRIVAPQAVLLAISDAPPACFDPGNLHSRPASGAPCSSRSSASLHRPLGALGSDPTGRGRRRSPGPFIASRLF